MRRLLLIRRPEKLRSGVSPQVERVSGATGFCFAEAMDCSVENLADSLFTFFRAVSTPGGDDQSNIWPPMSKRFVVARADGFRLSFHDLRVCRAEAERIHHEQAGKAPVLRKTDAPSNGWVIVGFIGS